MGKTIFENIITFKIRQNVAEHLIGLLTEELKEPDDLLTKRIYMPVLEELEIQFEKQKLK